MGGVEGEHGLRTDAHPERAPSFSWYATPAEARAEFDDRVEAFERHDGRLLLRIRLLEGGRVTEDRWVVRNPSTYDWRRPPTTPGE